MPFEKQFAALSRSLVAPAVVDEWLANELVTLIEREPELVAEQVRAWLQEEGS